MPIAEYWGEMSVPVGALGVVSDDSGLAHILLCSSHSKLQTLRESYFPDINLRHHVLLEQALSEIDEYFSGARKVFTLPLSANRRQTAFVSRVEQALLNVSYGQTISYRELAVLAKSPRAARAIGRAMACNHLPIVVPCHRVVGSDGSIGGYSAGNGSVTKQWLLDFERNHV